MDTLVFLDVETTGLDGHNERIIEIYMLKVLPDGQYEEFETLINPGKPISARITEITGITDRDVVNAPSEAELAPKIRSFLADGIPVAHNLSFDLKFLQSMFRRQSVDRITKKGVDTLQWSRRILPKLAVFPEGRGSHTLQNLMFQFGLDKDFRNSHRAKDDVHLLIQVYRMLEGMEQGSLQFSFPPLIVEGCPHCRRALHVVDHDQHEVSLLCRRPKGCGFDTRLQLALSD